MQLVPSLASWRLAPPGNVPIRLRGYLIGCDVLLDWELGLHTQAAPTSRALVLSESSDGRPAAGRSRSRCATASAAGRASRCGSPRAAELPAAQLANSSRARCTTSSGRSSGRKWPVSSTHSIVMFGA